MPMTRFALSAALATLSVLSAAAIPARADGVMLVYDASGSMRDTLPDGRTRVAVARQVVAGVLESWTAQTPLGLVAYGHRTSSCADIEVVIPATARDPARAAAAVRQLTPNGRTPLIEAIETAAEALAHVEGRRSVVAVTDGGESCRPDPCGDARALSQRLDVQVHVIAFDMLLDESEILSCIADETGGVFLRANDADTLADALSGALSRTGLAGAIYRARLRAEQASRFVAEGDEALERLAQDREAALEQFTVMKDMSGGVLEQLSEEAPLWDRLEALAQSFAERERAMTDRALSTGDPRFRELAQMWSERSRGIRALMDDVRTERARASGFLLRLDEDAYELGQYLALGLADEAIAVLRRTRDEVVGLNGSLDAVFTEVDRMLGEEGVEP